MIKVCVDAMGGEVDPSVVLEGVLQALEEDSELEVLVAGKKEAIQDFCDTYERATPLYATEEIGMDEHATDAFRRKKDSSIVVGCKAVKEGKADAFFSACNTGAIFTAATFTIGRIKGISRPCLATFLPGLNGHETICMDLGANADCRPEMLLGFATMGYKFARVVKGIENPKLGLLSNGEEDIKGNELTIKTHELLRESDLDFYGNCEGVDLLLGDFDVVVCDGFTGNCCLKTLEGTAKYLVSQIKAATKTSKRSALGALLLKPALEEIGAKLSGDKHGGAILLGVKAPVFIGHGSTSAEAVKNGCLAACRSVRLNVIEELKAK